MTSHTRARAQIQSGGGDVTITNDGATILKQIKVLHPVARMVSSNLSFSLVFANVTQNCSQHTHTSYLTFSLVYLCSLTVVAHNLSCSWWSCPRPRMWRQEMVPPQLSSLPAVSSLPATSSSRKVRIMEIHYGGGCYLVY